MKLTHEIIDRILVSIIALLAVLIPLLDFLGALNNLSWLSNRINVMTLLAIGVMSLYLISNNAKRFNRIKFLIESSHDNIIKNLNHDIHEKQILNVINEIWERREENINQLFDQCFKIAKNRSLDHILQFLDKTSSNFDNGIVFDRKLKQPWDINISAIDYSGVRLFHQKPDLVSTKPSSPQHPINQIINERDGYLIWENFLSGKLSDIKEFPYDENLRLTKVYFKSIPKHEIIIVVESHINILPDLKTTS